jgi:hypothetical protein
VGNLFYDIKGFQQEIVLIEKAPNDRIYNYQQLDLSARQQKEAAIYAHMSALVYLVRQHGAEPIVLFRETLENQGHSRDNGSVIAGQDWCDGRQAAWLLGLRAHHGEEADQTGEVSL